jgi:serine/threonine protein kinase
MSLCLPSGHMVGDYRIEVPLAVGALAITYLARDVGRDQPAILKEFMPPSLVGGRERGSMAPLLKPAAERSDYEILLRNFSEGAREIAQIDHPNIAAVRGILACNRTIYLAMDRHEEITLEQKLGGGRLEESEFMPVLAGAMDGLAALHARGLVHGNLRPASILLHDSGRPVLTGFELLMRPPFEPSGIERILRAGPYAPPELSNPDGAVGPWSDIYSLSAIAYRAMRGTPPVPAAERMRALIVGRPDPLVPPQRSDAPGYGDATLMAVAWGLEFEHGARPDSMSEWATLFPAAIRNRAFARPSRAAPEPSEGAGDARHSICVAAVDLPRAFAQHVPDLRTARIRPVRRRSRQRVLVAALSVCLLMILGGVLTVGVETGDIELAMPSLNATNEDGAARAAAAATSEPPPPPPPSRDAIRCSELAAHPDDPQRPRGAPGVAFEAISEAAARDAVAACTAALRDRPDDRAARFNLGRAHHRLSRLRANAPGEAARLAAEAYAAAAARGYAAAMGNLGELLYWGGQGVPRDDAKAVEWLRKAAEAGFPDAYWTLALAHASGRGVDKADARKSFCWLTLLLRKSTLDYYRVLAERQRARIALPPAERAALEAVSSPRDCL